MKSENIYLTYIQFTLNYGMHAFVGLACIDLVMALW